MQVGAVMYSRLGKDECPKVCNKSIELPFKLGFIGYEQQEIYIGNDWKIGFYNAGLFRTYLPENKESYDYTYDKNKEDLKAAANASFYYDLCYKNEGELEFHSKVFDPFDKNSQEFVWRC